MNVLAIVAFQLLSMAISVGIIAFFDSYAIGLVFWSGCTFVLGEIVGVLVATHHPFNVQSTG